MKWVIKDTPKKKYLQEFLSKSFGQFILAPYPIKSDGIDWNFYVYPKGHDKNDNQMYVEMYITSKSNKQTLKELSINIKLECNISSISWQKQVNLRAKKGTFVYRFEKLLKISHLQCIARQPPDPRIVFKCSVDIDKNDADDDDDDDDNKMNINNINDDDDDNKSNNIDNKDDDDDNKDNNNLKSDKSIEKENLLSPPPPQNNQQASISSDNSNNSNNSNDAAYVIVHSNGNKERCINHIDNKEFIWKITSKQFKQFLNSKIKELWISPIFEMNNSQWIMTCYPKGTLDDAPGSVAIYLECIKMDNNVHSMNILYDFSVTEIDGINNCNFHDFCLDQSDDNYSTNCYLITPLYLLENKQLKYLNSITFSIKLRILKLTYKNYISSMKVNGLGHVDRIFSFKLFKHIEAIWTLPVTTLLLKAKSEKYFISKRFDIWCLRLRPNDLNNSGRMTLELCLVTKPYGVCVIEVDIILKCASFNILWKRKHQFTGDSIQKSGLHWDNIDLTTKQLINLKSITFKCDIDVMGLYDVTGSKISGCFNNHDLNQMQLTVNQLKEQIAELKNQINVNKSICTNKSQ